MADRNHSMMNCEGNRLRSFNTPAWTNNPPVDLERLAKAGFYYTGNFLETKCYFCEVTVDNWVVGDLIMERHILASNYACPLLRTPNQCENVPIVSASPPINDINSTEMQVVQETTPQQQAAPNLKNEMYRLATFKNWPNANISPQSLAKAGFYYFNVSDQVKCAWCNGIIAQWEKGDNAFDEHNRFFPNCPRVQLGPLIDIASDGIQNLGIQHVQDPKKPKYSTLDARLRTYANWPISQIQDPEVLAESGFYFLYPVDHVRCFHCNGGLRSWQKEDDPWFEHAKWFPECHFVRLVKGPNYVQQVQESLADNNREESRGIASSSTCRASTSEMGNRTIMSLEEAMLSEPVRQALEMGLNEGRIRNAVNHHLECAGSSFVTTEELVEAVLEGQLQEGTEHNEGESEGTEESSSIVREVSRILHNIFIPRANEENIENGSRSDNARVVPEEDISRTNYTSPNMNDKPTTSAGETTTSMVTDVLLPTTVTECVGDLQSQISLEEENRKLKDARLCKVCMDDEVGVVFLPCGHLVTCVQCAPGVKQCPLCRSDIKGCVRTFLS